MTATTIAPHEHGVPALLTSGLRSYSPQDFPEVTVRQETWRFTPIAHLQPLLEGNAHLSTVTVTAPDGVQVDVQPAAGAPSTSYIPTDRLSAQVWSDASEVTIITIPRGEVIEEQITVDISCAQGAGAARVLIVCEQESSSTIVVRHSGPSVLGSIVLTHMGPASQAKITLVQDMQPGAVAAVYAHHIMDRDAVLRSNVVSMGGACVRVVPTVDYQGQGADAELNGICVAGPGEHIEHRCLVDHVVPNCRSKVTYKNVLTGTEAAPTHTVWIGDVIIHAAALGTDTYEMNRNLVLGDFARADSVPNLEIETGEIVGAGHASATGRLDDEQVFYMQSRGIEPHEAKRLIVRGFFEDLLTPLSSPQIAEAVRLRVEGLLA